MYGKGLLTGLGITLREFFRKKATEKYPEVRPKLSARFRGGRLALDPDKCIACSLCALNCPNGSIRLVTTKDENGKRKLGEYEYDAGACMYCNLCIESCPQKCIEWDKKFDFAGYSRQHLVTDCIAVAREKKNAAGGEGDKSEQ